MSRSSRSRARAAPTARSGPPRRPAAERDCPSCSQESLCYHRPRGDGSPMNTGFGAYLALFSEVGMILLVTTLVGVAAGYWADQQLGTLPAFALIGFLVGAGVGTVGIYRL